MQLWQMFLEALAFGLFIFGLGALVIIIYATMLPI